MRWAKDRQLDICSCNHSMLIVVLSYRAAFLLASGSLLQVGQCSFFASLTLQGQLGAQKALFLCAWHAALVCIGASRGIGQAIAEKMAEEKANLILLAQRKGALEEVLTLSLQFDLWAAGLTCDALHSAKSHRSSLHAHMQLVMYKQVIRVSLQ